MDAHGDHGHDPEACYRVQLAELRPSTQKAKVSAGLYSLVVTSVVFLLIALGSYAVFGEGVQSDVLHNFTPENLEPFLGSDIGTVLFIMVRLSFLVSVLSLFPLMVSPNCLKDA